MYIKNCPINLKNITFINDLEYFLLVITTKKHYTGASEKKIVFINSDESKFIY